MLGAQDAGKLFSSCVLYADLLEGIEVVVSESFPGSQGHDISLQLNNIAKKGVTIIFMACYSEDATRVVRGIFAPLTLQMTEVKNIETLASDRVVFVGTDSWLTPSF